MTGNPDVTVWLRNGWQPPQAQISAVDRQSRKPYAEQMRYWRAQYFDDLKAA
jgi:hypothetical protein